MTTANVKINDSNETEVIGGTKGSVLFVGEDGVPKSVLAQNNAQFHWDDDNAELSVAAVYAGNLVPTYRSSAFDDKLGDALSAIGTADDAVLLIDSNAIAEDTLTVTENVTLQFLQGGQIEVDDEKVVTVEGPVVAPHRQIFAGDGAVVFNSTQELSARWFDTPNAAFDAAPDGGTVVLPRGEFPVQHDPWRLDPAKSLHIKGAGIDQTIVTWDDANPQGTDPIQAIETLQRAVPAATTDVDEAGDDIIPLGESLFKVKSINGIEPGQLMFLDTAENMPETNQISPKYFLAIVVSVDPVEYTVQVDRRTPCEYDKTVALPELQFYESGKLLISDMTINSARGGVFFIRIGYTIRAELRRVKVELLGEDTISPSGVYGYSHVNQQMMRVEVTTAVDTTIHECVFCKLQYAPNCTAGSSGTLISHCRAYQCEHTLTPTRAAVGSRCEFLVATNCRGAIESHQTAYDTTYINCLALAEKNWSPLRGRKNTLIGCTIQGHLGIHIDTALGADSRLRSECSTTIIGCTIDSRGAVFADTGLPVWASIRTGNNNFQGFGTLTISGCTLYGSIQAHPFYHQLNVVDTTIIQELDNNQAIWGLRGDVTHIERVTMLGPNRYGTGTPPTENSSAAIDIGASYVGTYDFATRNRIITVRDVVIDGFHKGIRTRSGFELTDADRSRWTFDGIDIYNCEVAFHRGNNDANQNTDFWTDGRIHIDASVPESNGFRNARLPVLTGLTLWLDADDPTTVVINHDGVDGSRVARWEDKSGHGHHARQATAAAQPAWTCGVINGRSVIRFDGVDDVLALSVPGGDLIQADEYTAFAVFVARDVTTSGDVFNADAVFVDSGRFFGMMLYDHSTNGPETRAFNWSGSAQTVDKVIALDEAYLMTQRHGGGNLQLAENGGGFASTSTGNTTNISGTLQIGANPSVPSGAVYTEVDIAELIVYNKALSDREVADVNNYLRRKWGVCE